ncbi:MAG: superoxide dismutase [Candidatus Aminicenantes bacterium]|nr:MAG: superoxide dismutase [Candidatus Aminicenantes bacterium]
MKKSLSWVFFFTLIILSRPAVFSHCEVPCGIYNDEMRFTMITEHIQTIEKAMQQIVQLSKESSPNMNQTVRWVMNKEKHAEEIQYIIGQYFLTQRIKNPDSEDEQAVERYLKKLAHCHQILVFAMKTKQTTEMGNVEMLKSKVAAFKKIYFEDKK